jgi:hypothetical protein
MVKTLVVARTTAQEALRQPLFHVVILCFAGMIWASQFFTMFTLDDRLEGYLLREMGLSSIALCGALLAVLLSWLVVTREMERLTSLTILSKPIHRTEFLLGKYLGILGAVAYGSFILAAVLILSTWQKEGAPRFRTLSEIDHAVFEPEFSADFSAKIESVSPAPGRGNAWLVTLARSLPDRDSKLARAFGAPEQGRFMNATLSVWRANDNLLWTVESSRNADRGRCELVVLRADPRAGPAPAEPPRAGEDARVRPCHAGAAQRHLHDFWTRSAPDILKGALLALVRVAVLLALAASLAPHFPLVVNAAFCFVFFTLGHVMNYVVAGAALDAKGALFRWAGRIFFALLPNLENSRVESLVAAGRPISMEYVGWAAACGVAYSALVLVAGTAFFSRKEIR